MEAFQLEQPRGRRAWLHAGHGDLPPPRLRSSVRRYLATGRGERPTLETLEQPRQPLQGSDDQEETESAEAGANDHGSEPAGAPEGALENEKRSPEEAQLPGSTSEPDAASEEESSLDDGASSRPRGRAAGSFLARFHHGPWTEIALGAGLAPAARQRLPAGLAPATEPRTPSGVSLRVFPSRSPVRLPSPSPSPSRSPDAPGRDGRGRRPRNMTQPPGWLEDFRGPSGNEEQQAAGLARRCVSRPVSMLLVPGASEKAETRYEVREEAEAPSAPAPAPAPDPTAPFFPSKPGIREGKAKKPLGNTDGENGGTDGDKGGTRAAESGLQRKGSLFKRLLGGTEAGGRQQQKEKRGSVSSLLARRRRSG